LKPDHPSDTLPIGAVRTALRAFRRLLARGEITEQDPQLLNAVLADARVGEVLSVLEEEFEVRILRGRSRVDLSPDPDNRELGYRYTDLRERFGDRTGSAYLVILGLLALFFRSGNFRVPDYDHVELFDLEEYLTRKARAVVEREGRARAVEEAAGTQVFEPCREWLERDKYKEGRGHRSTRYAVIKTVLAFLADQGLVHRERTVGENERIYPTDKLKAQAEALALDDRYAAMAALLSGDDEALEPWTSQPQPVDEPEPRPEPPRPPRKRRKKAAADAKPKVLDLFGAPTR